jgi:hypothetical protein
VSCLCDVRSRFIRLDGPSCAGEARCWSLGSSLRPGISPSDECRSPLGSALVDTHQPRSLGSTLFPPLPYPRIGASLTLSMNGASLLLWQWRARWMSRRCPPRPSWAPASSSGTIPSHQRKLLGSLDWCPYICMRFDIYLSWYAIRSPLVYSHRTSVSPLVPLTGALAMRVLFLRHV